jgi:hypothetical protein
MPGPFPLFPSCHSAGAAHGSQWRTKTTTTADIGKGDPPLAVRAHQLFLVDLGGTISECDLDDDLRHLAGYCLALDCATA